MLAIDPETSPTVTTIDRAGTDQHWTVHAPNATLHRKLALIPGAQNRPDGVLLLPPDALHIALPAKRGRARVACPRMPARVDGAEVLPDTCICLCGDTAHIYTTERDIARFLCAARLHPSRPAVGVGLEFECPAAAITLGGVNLAPRRRRRGA